MGDYHLPPTRGRWKGPIWGGGAVKEKGSLGGTVEEKGAMCWLRQELRENEATNGDSSRRGQQYIPC